MGWISIRNFRVSKSNVSSKKNFRPSQITRGVLGGIRWIMPFLIFKLADERKCSRSRRRVTQILISYRVYNPCKSSQQRYCTNYNYSTLSHCKIVLKSWSSIIVKLRNRIVANVSYDFFAYNHLNNASRNGEYACVSTMYICMKGRNTMRGSQVEYGQRRKCRIDWGGRVL